MRTEGRRGASPPSTAKLKQGSTIGAPKKAEANANAQPRRQLERKQPSAPAVSQREAAETARYQAARGGVFDVGGGEPTSAHKTRAKIALEVIKGVAADWAKWGSGRPWRPPEHLEDIVMLSELEIAQLLWRLENPSSAEKAQATEQNRAVAAALSKSGCLPGEAVLAHVTNQEGAIAIIGSANFDTLFLKGGVTPTLGGVDFTRVEGTREGVSPSSVAESAESFGSVALLYDPGRFPSELTYQRGLDMGSYNDHWVHPVGAPNTALAAIQLLEKADAKQVSALGDALAKRGLYVPIVSTEGEVLFKPEDFERLS